MRRAAIVNREINPTALMAEIQSNEFGAISLFLGTVRETSDGRHVTGIEYSAYTSMAESELERILAEAQDKFGAASIVVEHRVGTLALGDVSIAIASAHAHRAPAIECTRFVIEEIKMRVPVWKLEHYANGSREWVDPTRSSGAVSA